MSKKLCKRRRTLERGQKKQQVSYVFSDRQNVQSYQCSLKWKQVCRRPCGDAWSRQSSSLFPYRHVTDQ